VGGVIPDASYHWWDLRLHPGFGTVEVRVCDTQTDLDDTVSLVALTQALVAWLIERHDAGETLPVHDGYRIAESLWLAAHVGATRDLLDLDTGARRPLPERIAELLEALGPTARELGTESELARLATLATWCGADRQRQVVQAVGIDRLPAWLTAESTASARRVRARADAHPTSAPQVAAAGDSTRAAVAASA
jgi:glutamate---cysteine ligase / carboxylate-amine ligase